MKGLVFLLFLCRMENLIIQWALENVMIVFCLTFITQVLGPAK